MHPREGILVLTPFKALERISMTGNPRCAAAGFGWGASCRVDGGRRDRGLGLPDFCCHCCLFRNLFAAEVEWLWLLLLP